MKTYRLIVTPEAQSGIRDSFRYIHVNSPKNATSSLQELYRHLETLERFPKRCAFAREAEYMDGELR